MIQYLCYFAPPDQGLHLTIDLFTDCTDSTILPTPERPATPRTSHLPLIQRNATVDKDEPDPLGSEFGFVECRSVPDLVRVEKD